MLLLLMLLLVVVMMVLLAAEVPMQLPLRCCSPGIMARCQ
jgi:hypothetical protein